MNAWIRLTHEFHLRMSEVLMDCRVTVGLRTFCANDVLEQTFSKLHILFTVTGVFRLQHPNDTMTYGASLSALSRYSTIFRLYPTRMFCYCTKCTIVSCITPCSTALLTVRLPLFQSTSASLWRTTWPSTRRCRWCGPRSGRV